MYIITPVTIHDLDEYLTLVLMSTEREPQIHLLKLDDDIAKKIYLRRWYYNVIIRKAIIKPLPRFPCCWRG